MLRLKPSVLAALATAFLASGVCVPAQAQHLSLSPNYAGSAYTASFDTLVGRTVQVEVVAPSTDRRFLMFRASPGVNFVGGQEGQPYAVVVRNLTAERLLVVPSVDGINTISGQTASVQQGGYVLEAYGQVRMDGWRKSMRDVAQFVFTAQSNSYAAQTDRPSNVGVIGLAVFREMRPAVIEAPREPWTQHHEPRWEGERLHDAPVGSSASPTANGAPTAPAAARSSIGSAPVAADSSRMQQKSFRAQESLGTGHGERQESAARETTFRRASSEPAEVLQLQYDSLSNLEERGVAIRARVPSRPNPFPANSFVPDPPRR